MFRMSEDGSSTSTSENQNSMEIEIKTPEEQLEEHYQIVNAMKEELTSLMMRTKLCINLLFSGYAWKEKEAAQVYRSSLNRKQSMNLDKLILFHSECKFYLEKCELLEKMYVHLTSHSLDKKRMDELGRDYVLKNMIKIYISYTNIEERIGYFGDCVDLLKKETHDIQESFQNVVSDEEMVENISKFNHSDFPYIPKKSRCYHQEFDEILLPLYELQKLIQDKKNEFIQDKENESEDNKQLIILLEALEKIIDFKKASTDKVIIDELVEHWIMAIENAENLRNKKYWKSKKLKEEKGGPLPALAQPLSLDVDQYLSEIKDPVLTKKSKKFFSLKKSKKIKNKKEKNVISNKEGPLTIKLSDGTKKKLKKFKIKLGGSQIIRRSKKHEELLSLELS